MARSFKHSDLTAFLKSTGVLESISRRDFNSDEEYERCRHELIEGAKIILMDNDGDPERSRAHLLQFGRRIKRAIKDSR